MVCLLLGARWIDYRGPRSIGSPRRGQWSRCTASVRIFQGKLIRPPNYRREEIARFVEERMISPISKLSGKIEDCRDTALRTVLSEMNRSRDGFGSMEDFVCVIRFLLFIWILLRVVCVSSKEARNRSNLL